MKVAIRTDASIDIGSGHVMRCLTLADVLSERSAEVRFLCRELPGNLCQLIADRGYPVSLLPAVAPVVVDQMPSHAAWLVTDWQTDATQTMRVLDEQSKPDWMVIDHYALDRRWEEVVAEYATNLMVIDDLADRPHQCNMLLDQNFYLDQDRRYTRLVPAECRQLLGPSYSLLRSEFRKARAVVKERSGVVRRILVFFGASDIGNDTVKALQAIAALANAKTKYEVDVVIGVNNPHRLAIRELADKLDHARCHDYVNNMAELMTRADLYLGAAGTTTWERCCLGLPSLIVAVSANQSAAIADIESTGAARVLGDGSRLSSEDILLALTEAIENPAALAACSRAGMALLDGSGTEKCVNAMFEQSGKSYG